MSQRDGAVIVVGLGEPAAALSAAARASGWPVEGEPMAPREFIETDPAVARALVAAQDLPRETTIDIVWACFDRSVDVWLDRGTLPVLEPFVAVRRMGSRGCIPVRPPRRVSALRRAIDVVAVSGALLVLLPLLGVIAVAVKLSSQGRVFHRAEVVGEDGRRFTWYKFRTMRPANDDEATRRERFAAYVRGHGGPTKILDEQRITPIGRLLRRHSLDELPQLWSVLKGDMTLIGPRPCLIYEYELLRPWHRRRFAVRPGLTGLWQVRGRGQVHADEMAFMDICYMLARTWRSDLRVLWETITVVLTGRGAV